MTADADLLEQYLALDTATVSDALDGCGLPPGQGGLRPMWGRPRIAGFAVTVELEPLTGRPDGAHILTDAIAAAGADDIMVVANDGRTDVSSWGGIVSVGAAMRSVRGVVTDGACRDVEQARDLGFPVFARAQVPVTARGRLRQRSAGAPVRLGQVTVSPGDVVMADEGGVVVIPRARAAEVLAAARGVRAREEQIEREVRAGLPLPQAMRDAWLAGTPGAPTGSVTGGQEHDVLSRLRALPTAAISDALDREGIPGAVEGLAPLSDTFRATGPAFTARYAPADAAGGTVGDFLDEVPPGAVIVIGNDGRRDVTVWGGIMTEVASARGMAGTVIDGVCRDVAASLSHGYPLFSRGRFMRTGKDRVRLVSVGEPLTISGIGIRPGTIVCADADGVVAVPEGPAERVADEAERIEQVERQIVAAVRGGESLRQARATFGYHDLQRRRS